MNDENTSAAHAGLTEQEAEARLAAEGFNELPGGEGRSVLAVMRDVLREPMLMLLLAGGVIYMLLGELREALVLLVFAGLSVAIAIVQEARAERAIDSLRSLAMPQVLVIRGGHRRRIPSREVVRGDLVAVGEGDRLTADGWIVEASGLQVDEAVLTGESMPVSKAVLADGLDAGAEPPRPGGEELPYLYSGTLAVRGAGTMLVAATGPRTEIGKIGQSLASLETEVPHLTRQPRRLVQWLAAFGIGVSVLAVLLYGLLRGDWLEALLSGIAVAMSMLPEELPVVLTLFMTMGALRMSRSRVLARRGNAIETLGAATVLCTDKTGTLTENRMQVVELRLPDGTTERLDRVERALDGPLAELASLGVFACLEDPFDPMEQAFHDLAGRSSQPHLGAPRDGGLRLRRQYPFSPELLAMTNVWAEPAHDQCLVAAKGAPEAIAELCGLSDGQRQALETAVEDMASSGLRVLGVAETRSSPDNLPEHQREFDFVFKGLVGLADPVRPSVPDAVRQLQEGGIRVMMITGDYPATAKAIAAQAGIAGGGVLTGEEIGRMDDGELARRIGGVAVFARVMPDQKLRIVRALKQAGEVVAMTGDGVNDAPSLKAAHIGIAMGGRGTDVAREASAIVLLDDDFGSIVSAVRLGRRIYDNLRKAAGFIFAIHLPIGGLAIAPLLIGWPLILGPIHIALLEMVVDPVCSLAFEAEPEEPDVMTRSPRAPDSLLVSRSLLAWAVLQGSMALVALLALAAWANLSGMGADAARTTCFAGLIVAVLTLVLANRSFRAMPLRRAGKHNRPLAAIMGFVVVGFGLVFLSPSVAELFDFAVLRLAGLEGVAVMAAVLIVLLGLAKRRFRRALVA